MTNSQVWFKGVRSSKFRHVYGEPAKREKCYDNISITRNAHDSQFCAVNPKFVALVTEVAGGGAFIVIPIEKTGRLDFNASRVTGHTGPVLDIKWNPFNDNVIASGSEDCTIKLWHIPDAGLTTHLTECLKELQGHKRRVTYIEWHPSAENILFTTGFDHLIFIWNIETGETVNIIDCHPDVIYSMSLNLDGSLLATTCKDKRLRIIEPRSGLVKNETVCHHGSKASKVTFLGRFDRLLTTGFSKHSDRQYSIWDCNNLNKSLITNDIDNSSGVIFPFYDSDTNIVYLAGKGDGNIRYYEITSESPYIHFLSQFLSGNPQRGLGCMPKRGLHIYNCEISRFYKLHAVKGICEPISMIVPRKNDRFHEDLYPDTAAAKPSLTPQEWIQGLNAKPILMSLKIGGNNSTYTPIVYTKPVVPSVVSHNNIMKFAFLSTETIPDYRPKNLIEEKNNKTTTNQTTKFQQLQQKFANNDIPLIKEYNNEINLNNENDLKLAYRKQSEELRQVKNQLANSQRKIRELESLVQTLQRRE